MSVEKIVSVFLQVSLQRLPATGSETARTTRRDGSLDGEEMKATQRDRERSVGPSCGNRGGVSESIPEGNEEARGVSECGWRSEVRGRSEAQERLTVRETVSLPVPLGRRVSAQLTERHPALPAAHYLGPIITQLQGDAGDVTRMKKMTPPLPIPKDSYIKYICMHYHSKV